MIGMAGILSASANSEDTAVNGHEEVRAGGHEISGSVDIKIPDVQPSRPVVTGAVGLASSVEWVHSVAGEGLGEAV
ncbi:hypothetical protein [Streptomyces sp. NPDC127092]|uniref:hypothetical protein n=1 Tax=Streptomyces sp. NPDC127092 TaxID=3347135 RepID=UPI003657BF4E